MYFISNASGCARIAVFSSTLIAAFLSILPILLAKKLKPY